jgi:hypothetical protein
MLTKVMAPVDVQVIVALWPLVQIVPLAGAVTVTVFWTVDVPLK